MHEIATINNQASFAFVGQPAWHGLGQQLQPGADAATWATNAGLAWTALQLPNQAARPDGSLFSTGNTALVRSDTLDWLEPVVLGQVSDGWKPVQPVDVLDVMGKICARIGATMETAGALRDGRRIFALAKMPNSLDLGKDDRTEQYAVIYTGFDGTLSTTVKQTSVRVVCANTLALSVARGVQGSHVSFTHRSDPATHLSDRVVQGLADDWAGFERFAQAAAATTLRGLDLREFMHVLASRLVLQDGLALSAAAADIAGVSSLEARARDVGKRGPSKARDLEAAEIAAIRAAAKVAELRETLVTNAARAPGQNTDAASESLWGAINAVSYTFGRGQDVTRHTKATSTNIAERRLGMASNAHERVLAELCEEILTRPARGVSLEDVGIGMDDHDGVRAQVLSA